MNKLSNWLTNRENATRKFLQRKDAIIWIVFFAFILMPVSAFAADPPGVCKDAALMAQWWAWVGAGWGAGVMLGVFAANPIGMGLIGVSVVGLQIFSVVGGPAGVC